MLAEVSGSWNISVRPYGRLPNGGGRTRGLMVHEFTEAELNYHDSRFAVEVRAQAVQGLTS